MSLLFDTIEIYNLMQGLEIFLNEDECRMARLLLGKTTIKI